LVVRKLTPFALCAALAAALLLPTGAGSDELAEQWASVNICSPAQLGARAQIAGDGSTSDMRVRFTAQWLSPSGGWVALGGAASSPWQSAGSAEYTWGQAGWTFALSVPPGHQYQLRAVAEIQVGGKSSSLVTGTCTVGG
jgi:hypothetical protein